MKDESKKIEIILGNKNVAEAGSQQINITQNNFDPDKLRAALNGLTGSPVSQPTKGKPGRKKKENRERDGATDKPCGEGVWTLTQNCC